MRTLVTGGHGFLARVVAAYLRDHDHDVSLLSHTTAPGTPLGVRVLKADLRDRASIYAALNGPQDAVIHLAGLGVVRDSITHPLAYFDLNTAGTLNLLLALRDAAPGQHPAVVFASTQTVYGTDHDDDMTEDTPPRPEHPYALSKLSAEQILASHAATGAVGAATFRLVNLAGAYGDFGDVNARGLIPKALRAAIDSETFAVNGDGSTVRDYVHVTDVAAAAMLAIDAIEPGEHAIYNIGSGRGASVMDILSTVEEVTGRPIAVEHRPAVPEPRRLVVDNRRAQALLGWKPTRSDLPTIIRDAWHAARLADAP